MRLSWIGMLVIGLATIAPAQQIAIGEYAVPTPGGVALAIAPGPDHALWFTDLNSNAIGRCTTAAAIIEYTVPTHGAAPVGIAQGPDGAMWFTEQNGNNIGRITATGTITEYPLPVSNELPQQISAGPDGALWFTAPGTAETGGGEIGRITTAGAITQYKVADGKGNPVGIASGPDGALWFTDLVGDAIGRITTSGSMTEYALPNADSGPTGITEGPDGALWFTEAYGSRIGRITTAGAITEYVLAVGSNPLGIALGPDGALWFGEARQLGRVTTAGAITQYPLPYQASGVTTGPDGELWLGNVYVGEAVFVTANLTVTPDSATDSAPLTFSGSGFAPNETVRIYTRGIGSEVLTKATADGSGAITATATNPTWFYGKRSFYAMGETSRKLAGSSLSIEAVLTLTPDSGPAGTSVTVNGSGFGPFEAVPIIWTNPNYPTGVAATDINGVFKGYEFVVPSNTRGGTHAVVGKGHKTKAQAGGRFTID